MADIKGAVDLALKAEEDKMDAMEEMICKLVNFEAFIMERCIKAVTT